MVNHTLPRVGRAQQQNGTTRCDRHRGYESSRSQLGSEALSNSPLGVYLTDALPFAPAKVAAVVPFQSPRRQAGDEPSTPTTSRRGLDGCLGAGYNRPPDRRAWRLGGHVIGSALQKASQIFEGTAPLVRTADVTSAALASYHCKARCRSLELTPPIGVCGNIGALFPSFLASSAILESANSGAEQHIRLRLPRTRASQNRSPPHTIATVVASGALRGSSLSTTGLGWRFKGSWGSDPHGVSRSNRLWEVAAGHA